MKDEPTLLLPQKLRPSLKRPLGQLFPNINSAVEHLKHLNPTRLISVGDMVTAEFLTAGITPDVVVVDFVVMRSPAPGRVRKLIDSLDAKVMHVKNPAGTITSELRVALQAKPPLKIIVEGEEDLATIPAVLSAPRGSVVIYGQPNEGVVLVEVTESKRREFTELLNRFKPAGVK